VTSLPATARPAVGALFVLNGVLVASWVSRIPAVKEQVGLGDAQLGLALLAIAAGALSAFPLAGWSVSRLGGRRVAVAGLLLMAASLVTTALAPSLVILAVTLFLYGAGNGVNDVAMNSLAVEVERAYRRPLLSSFHALWSGGALLGAGIGALLIGASLAPLGHFVVVTVVTAALVLGVVWRLLPTSVTSRPPAARGAAPRRTVAWPSRALWGVGLVAFAAALSEGAMGDWSALYLRESLGTGEAAAAAGYASFSVAMLVARALGDAMTARWGAARVVAQGGALAAVGLGVALLVAEPWATLLGFACVGWGVASAFPLAFSAAGNAPGVDQGFALAAVATLGYSGFLVGPVLIGVLSDGFSLRVALGVVVAFALVMVVLSPSLRPARPAASDASGEAERPPASEAATSGSRR
jgi:MFS family permease